MPVVPPVFTLATSFTRVEENLERNTQNVMVDQNDFRGQRIARAEFARRGIDISRSDLYVMHGVLYMRGEVKAMPNANFNDISHEMALVTKILRQRPEIRDIVLEIKHDEITERHKVSEELAA
jgi:hypothetical protein